MSALSNSYHPACFICVACMAPINESTFNSTADFTDDGTRLPVHSTCYKELYIPRCVVCQDTVTQDPSTGGYTFQKHPYFQDWKYCSVHNNRRRCTGCSRVEPLEGFADINDAGRCLCESCCRTVILESGELKDLWGDVLEFMEALGMVVFRGMRQGMSGRWGAKAGEGWGRVRGWGFGGGFGFYCVTEIVFLLSA